MRTGIVLFLLCICFTSSTIISQNQNLSKDSLELSFYPISGLENYHSENDCKITGSAWIDSLSVKINISVKDDYLKLDKPYNQGDFIEIIFAVPELRDSGNIFIVRDNVAYNYKMTNDIIKFKQEWKNPLIKFEDFEFNKAIRYKNLVKENKIELIEDVKKTIDPENFSKFTLKHIPYGETNFLFYPGPKSVVNGNREKIIEKFFTEEHEYGFEIPKLENKVTYSTHIDSNFYNIQLTFPISSFAYISAKLAHEIKFLINVVDVDSENKSKTIFSISPNANNNMFSSYVSLYSDSPFMDSITFSRILPNKYDSSISPIFLNTTEGWKPLEKEITNLGMVTSLIHYKTPNLYGIDFRFGTVEHRIINNFDIHIYSNTDFNRPYMSKDYVTVNDSLVFIVDELITVVKLNSGKLGYVFDETYYFFGECRGGVQPCGCCTLTDTYFATEQDTKTGKSNKLKICSQEDPNHMGVSFYPTVFVDLDNEKEGSFNFNLFKDNTFTMRFSDKKVVKIKVDEEKWRLIFIKNW